MVEQWLAFIAEYEQALLVLGAFSLVTFIATLLIVPWVIVRLPADYFTAHKRSPLLAEKLHPSLILPIVILKNFFGLMIVLCGIIMLVIPGQGVLTISIGILVMDFPGKFKIERWLIQRKTILRSMNWLRSRRGKQPLTFDTD